MPLRSNCALISDCFQICSQLIDKVFEPSLYTTWLIPSNLNNTSLTLSNFRESKALIHRYSMVLKLSEELRISIGSSTKTWALIEEVLNPITHENISKILIKCIGGQKFIFLKSIMSIVLSLNVHYSIFHRWNGFNCSLISLILRCKISKKKYNLFNFFIKPSILVD